MNVYGFETDLCQFCYSGIFCMNHWRYVRPFRFIVAQNCKLEIMSKYILFNLELIIR